mmetsp:Transcript_11009/g.23581  ORF Transcript_11009/g.23581 Transcript_11009/m.23581 type:complete len:253 (+) Transcript_11009:3353-4111(+)
MTTQGDSPADWSNSAGQPDVGSFSCATLGFAMVAVLHILMLRILTQQAVELSDILFRRGFGLLALNFAGLIVHNLVVAFGWLLARTRGSRSLLVRTYAVLYLLHTIVPLLFSEVAMLLLETNSVEHAVDMMIRLMILFLCVAHLAVEVSNLDLFRSPLSSSLVVKRKHGVTVATKPKADPLAPIAPVLSVLCSLAVGLRVLSWHKTLAVACIIAIITNAPLAPPQARLLLGNVGEVVYMFALLDVFLLKSGV